MIATIIFVFIVKHDYTCEYSKLFVIMYVKSVHSVKVEIYICLKSPRGDRSIDYSGVCVGEAESSIKTTYNMGFIHFNRPLSVNKNCSLYKKKKNVKFKL